MIVPDKQILSAEQVAEAVEGAEYRNDRMTDWAFADLAVVPLVTRWLLTAITQMPWSGLPHYTQAFDYVVNERNIFGLPEAPPWTEQMHTHHSDVRKRALKLTLDAYRELHAATLMRDVVGVTMVMDRTADVTHGYDVVFRPPTSWMHAGPIGVQIACRQRQYVKPRQTHTAGITEVKLYVEPPANGYDGSVALATRQSVTDQVLHWQHVLITDGVQPERAGR